MDALALKLPENRAAIEAEAWVGSLWHSAFATLDASGGQG
jgi:hypothetical protein